jgi:F0F1-type ATP synthase membrane subunit b/b'
LIRKSLFAVLFCVSLAIPTFARNESEKAVSAEESRSDSLMTWKWANFALLMAGLGYLIAKQAPAFFNQRSEDIQKAIKDATGLKVEAEFRASEIDRKMATLSGEINKLREEAKIEMEREGGRIQAETQAALKRIQDHTENEIEALRRQAQTQFRQRTVRIAYDLAVAQLRERPQHADQSTLIRSFTSKLQKGEA